MSSGNRGTPAERNGDEPGSSLESAIQGKEYVHLSVGGRLSSGRSNRWVTWEGACGRDIRVGILMLPPSPDPFVLCCVTLRLHPPTPALSHFSLPCFVTWETDLLGLITGRGMREGGLAGGISLGLASGRH